MAPRLPAGIASTASVSSMPALEVEGPLSLPLAVIDVHSSAATFNRVRLFHKLFFAGDPFIQNGTFVMRAILAKSATVDVSPYAISRVECSDAHQELPCRVDAAYRSFIAEYPNCRWHLRLDDDTFLNTSVFYHRLVQLNRIYNGMETMVFRAHANPEKMRRFYIHGGSGWLCSRAFLDMHVKLDLRLVSLLKWARYHQQDTAQSIIVRLVFHHPEMWDEMGMQGYACDQCQTSLIQRGQWDSLRKCPDNMVAVRVRDLWALHTASVQEGFLKFIQAIPHAPPDVMLMRDPGPQRSFPCRKGPKTIVWDPNRRNLAFVKMEDLPDPFINFATLPNDNLS
jgi:hypothetical protein